MRTPPSQLLGDQVQLPMPKIEIATPCAVWQTVHRVREHGIPEIGVHRNLDISLRVVTIRIRQLVVIDRF